MLIFYLILNTGIRHLISQAVRVFCSFSGYPDMTSIQSIDLSEYRQIFSGSHLEQRLFNEILATSHLLVPVREYRFSPDRRWRFDFAWPCSMVAVEVEGGTYHRSHSRHTSGTGFHDDCIKYNAAVLLGWKVLRFDSHHIRSGMAIELIRKVLS